MADPTSSSRPPAPATHVSRVPTADNKFRLQKNTYNENNASGTFKFRGETYRISLEFADGPHGMSENDFKIVLNDINTLIQTTITYDTFAKADSISIKDKKIKTHIPGSSTTAEKNETKEIEETDAANETLNKINTYAIRHRFASTSTARSGARRTGRSRVADDSISGPARLRGALITRVSEDGTGRRKPTSSLLGSDSDDSDESSELSRRRRVHFADSSDDSSSESSDGYSSGEESDSSTTTPRAKATSASGTSTVPAAPVKTAAPKPAASATGSSTTVTPATAKATPPKPSSWWGRNMPTFLGGDAAKPAAPASGSSSALPPAATPKAAAPSTPGTRTGTGAAPTTTTSAARTTTTATAGTTRTTTTTPAAGTTRTATTTPAAGTTASEHVITTPGASKPPAQRVMREMPKPNS